MGPGSPPETKAVPLGVSILTHPQSQPRNSGAPSGHSGSFGLCHLPTSKTCSWRVPVVGRFHVGSPSFSEMSHLRLRVQQVSSSPHPFGPMGRSLLESPGQWAQHWPPSAFLSPQTPSWLLPVPALPLSYVVGSPNQGWVSCPIPLSPLMLLLSVALEVYRAGVGLPGILALNFSCMCACVLSCSRFDFEGLESGDDGAFDKLRSWSRSIEDLQPPSALSAPFTNSLARSARQSVLRYVCSCSARLPPPAPVQVLVTAVSAHAPPSTLASRLSSLASACQSVSGLSSLSP